MTLQWSERVAFLKRITSNLLRAVLAGTLLLLAGCAHKQTGGVLNPKGLVAAEQYRLMMDCVALMLIVVIPVIIMSFAFAHRYSIKNKDPGKYRPNWSHNSVLESVWWGVPCVIIVILGIITWISSHKLDPYRKLDVPGKPPIQIQAVALRWKWLFIYPNQKIATINELDIPVNRQVQFLITSDAPMSAFFIPQLGSQIYAMAGMRTRLHLVANHKGVYEGLDSQYNGEGFSDMHFKVHVTTQKKYADWLKRVRKSKLKLDIPEYQKIVKPTIANPVVYYSHVKPKLFKRIMEQYTKPNMRLHYKKDV